MLVWIHTQCTHTNTLAFILTLFYSARGKKNFLLQEVFSPRQSIRTHGSARRQSFIYPPLCEWWKHTQRQVMEYRACCTITASCCLTAWRNQKPHVKLSQPEPHTYHLLIRNTDKSHLFPILSSVQPSDLLMGRKSKHHLCQPKERSSYDFC